MTKDSASKTIKDLKQLISRRTVSAVLFLLLLLSLQLFVSSRLNSARESQKNMMLENANAYSRLMDERISIDLYNYLTMNLDPALESSSLDDFFYSTSPARQNYFSRIKENAAECVEMAENLDGLILYRTSDNTLLSTLSDYRYLAKINPAYPYLMSAIAQVSGETASFVYSSDGSVLYYYPVFTEKMVGNTSGQVNDCVIALLHRSEDFLGVNISPTSSTATFAVLREGQVLSAEGYNALSQKLVSSIAGLARSASSMEGPSFIEDSSSMESSSPTKKSFSIYTYEDETLPDYYFYLVPSAVSELEYCYYEPALSGLSLLERAFSLRSILLAGMLLIGIIFFGLLFLLSSPVKRKSGSAPENAFGTLPNFSGILIDYNGMDRQKLTPETLELLDQVIRDNLTFNKILFRPAPQQFVDCLQYHINYTNYNMRVLCDSMKMNLYNTIPDCRINIYYGNTVASCQEMEQDLLYLHQRMNYSLVLGYNIRLSVQQIQTFEANTEILASNVTGTIRSYLQAGAYENLYTYLNHYKDITAIYPHPYSFMKWYSFSERYRFAEEAFSTVKLFFQEKSYEHPILHTTCNSVLQSNPGFHHLCEYLISCVQDYQKDNPHVQHVISDRNEQIMNTIYKLIEEDLAGANLSSIAGKMQMTDSHLSRLFKKNTGLNFSEYLSEKRLEEAARLLTQDTKQKVADISEILGYGNPTYFLARFKAKYGVSPSAYRKAHIMETAENRPADSDSDPDSDSEP